MSDDATPAKVRLTDGLGPLVERLLKYSDIRRNDPRENREALRDLIIGELADELQAVRKAEREQCAALVPTNWLDPLLTGPKSLVRATDDCRMVERLLQAVADRIRGPNVGGEA